MSTLCCMCESVVYPGHGSLFIKNDMRSLWFCRSKCKKNFNQKKNPLYLRWTRFNRKKRGAILNKKILFTSFINQKIEQIREYDIYLISHVLFQLERLRNLNRNRSIDFNYKKKTKF
jgi:large subunit ribosomal protein L24e